MSTASSTVGSSSVVGTLPVWPPPSPPWIITASAPQPATFSACRAAPTDGITTMPASLSFAIRSGFGRERERRHLHAVPDQQVAAVGRVAGVGPQVDPERLVGAALDLEDRVLELVVGHGRAGQDAETAGVGRAGHEARPGDPAHPGLDDGVADAGELGQGSAQQLLDHCAFSGSGTSRWRSAFGSSTSRIRISSSVVGSRVVGTSAGDVELEPGRRAHLVDGHAGVDREQAQGVVGAADVEDARGW